MGFSCIRNLSGPRMEPASCAGRWGSQTTDHQESPGPRFYHNLRTRNYLHIFMFTHKIIISFYFIGQLSFNKLILPLVFLQITPLNISTSAIPLPIL